MPQWNEIQGKAKKLIDEGLELLKSGAHKAGHLAGTTTSAAKLHVEIKKSRIEIYRSLHELGLELYKQMANEPNALTAEVPEEMRSIASRVKGLEETIRADEQKLERFSVVKKDSEGG